MKNPASHPKNHSQAEKPQLSKRRPSQRPAEILDAAAQVFAHEGYDRATTKQIAAAAGVSEGSLYRYFPNKKGILIALLKAHMDAALAETALLGDVSLEEWMADTVTRRIRLSHERPLTIMILQQAMSDPDVGRAFVEMNTRLREKARQQMNELESRGALRDVDPIIAQEAMGSIIMGLTIGAELGAHGWHQEPLSPEALGKGIADVLANGLRANATCHEPQAGRSKKRR